MRYTSLKRRAKSIAGLALIAALASSLAVAAPAAASSVRPAAPAAAQPGASSCLAGSDAHSSATCTGEFAGIPVSRARAESAAADSAAAFPAPPAGLLSPSILAQAYGLQGDSTNSSAFVSDEGERMTVALVEAGLPVSGDTLAAGNAQLLSDLENYRAAYGFPNCTEGNGCLSFKTAGADPTSYYGNWGLEYAMDLDVISAICANCRIVVVEAATDEDSALAAAANVAATTPGVDVVDNTYGTPEFQTDASGNSEQYYDANDYDHPGVAMIAASGGGPSSGTPADTGYGPLMYPAASPDVISVGGTVLSQNSSTEQWYDSSLYANTISGCSSYEPAPSWQTEAATLCPAAPGSTSPMRVDNDIAAAAAMINNGNEDITPFPFVYDGGWMSGGGTALSADIMAGIYALAGPPTTGVNPASYLYTHATSSGYDLNDITSGSTNGCPSGSQLCTAAAGWDPPTGWGTPDTTLTLTPTGSVTGQIRDNTTGWCVDNFENGAANGNKIDYHQCGGANQTWSVRSDGTIRMYSGTYCIGTSGGGVTVNTSAVLWSCDGAANQQWRFTSGDELYNPNSRRCLGDPNSTQTNGDQMAIVDCGTTNTTEYLQQPYSVPTATGEILSRAGTSKCVDNRGGLLTAGNPVQIYDCNGMTDTQQWTIAADGSIQIGGDMCVDVNLTGDILNNCDYDNDGFQMWIDLADGNLYNPGAGECLYEPSLANKTQVGLNTCRDASDEEWTLP